jgi:hypothetical protein
MGTSGSRLLHIHRRFGRSVKMEGLLECTEQLATRSPTFRKVCEDDGLLGAVRYTFADASENM